MTWTYDRGDHRDNHEADVTEPTALETLLGKIHQAGEPVVVFILADTAHDPDDLPPGLQVGLGHPTHAFAVHIADDGGYLRDRSVDTPPRGIRFDFGGVPTEYPVEHLCLNPETAIQVAGTFLATGGDPPHVPAVSE
ncbi:Imm1 family immunity protein [Micromonospora sp. NPDC000207]|uniref:Imm1 family immunity protein n=1 Tax=Micromonospora sp. NPDC000207 TaxID=3154246 RepID=UPI00331737F4